MSAAGSIYCECGGDPESNCCTTARPDLWQTYQTHDGQWQLGREVDGRLQLRETRHPTHHSALMMADVLNR